MSERDEYEGQLAAWEAEKERQKVEFTITENDPYADLRIEDNCSGDSEVKSII